MVFYEYRKLNEHKKNYVTHDLELEGIINTFKMWRNYILGRIFVLMRDHSGLRYFFHEPNLNIRQVRWLPILSKFDFEIIYIKGKENRVANAISSKAQMNHIKAMSSYGTES